MRPDEALPTHIQLALNWLKWWCPRWIEKLGLSKHYGDVRYFKEDGNIVLCLHAHRSDAPDGGKCAIALATPEELRVGSWRQNAQRITEESVARLSLGLGLTPK